MNTDVFGDGSADAPVLVVVINNPDDMERARSQGWYRIPLAHAPPRIGADFLAFYQTAAFPPGERWCVRWVAPVRGYRLATRAELLPEQSDHPRAAELYYRVALGELVALPKPIPSRRLRRITFIRSTLQLLCEAREINDLWLRTPAQERLWQALQQAGLADAAEHAYPLVDELPYTADFALFVEEQRVAVLLLDADGAERDCVSEPPDLRYPLARGGWTALFVDTSRPHSVQACLQTLSQLSSTERNAL